METYNLSYDDLVNGQYYTTNYPDQGLYTFRNGYVGWVKHGDYYHSNNGNFTPENGFNAFRLANSEEIVLFDNKQY